MTYIGGDGIPIEKKSVKKVIYGKTWILGSAGADNERSYRFNRMMSGDKRYKVGEDTPDQIINRAIDKYSKSADKFEGAHFLEVNVLNTISYRNKKEEDDELKIDKFDEGDFHSFVLASNYPSMSLWKVDIFGNLRPPDRDEIETEFLEYIVIGSGADTVRKYMGSSIESDRIIPMEIDISKAIDIAVDALHKAEKDIFTGFPMDLIVLTASEVESYGERINETITRAERDEIKKIKENYKAK